MSLKSFVLNTADFKEFEDYLDKRISALTDRLLLSTDPQQTDRDKGAILELKRLKSMPEEFKYKDAQYG